MLHRRGEGQNADNDPLLLTVAAAYETANPQHHRRALVADEASLTR